MASGVYKKYDQFKQLVKRFIPDRAFRLLVNHFHLLETVLAQVMNFFPTRGTYVIGVTGTNGKTTTIAFIASILEAAGYKVGVSSTAFYKVGDEYWDNDLNMTATNPFLLFPVLRQMKKQKVDYMILEVPSHALVQHRFFGVHFDAAAMTNLTQDHLDYHKTMKRYAAAKGRLLRRAKRVVALNRDDEWYEFFNKYHALQKLSYGVSKEADCRILKANLKDQGAAVQFMMDDFKFKAKLQLTGKFNVYNALAAASLAYGMDIDKAAIKDGLEHLKSVPGRLEPIESGQSFNVFIDYAHSPDALENLLSTVRSVTKGRVIAVFGATGDRDRSKRPLMGEIGKRLADIAILTDEEPYSEKPEDIIKEVKEGADKIKKGAKVLVEVDRGQAIEKAIKIANKDDSVVISGMGHQQYRVVGDKKLPWDDREVARNKLSQL